MRGIEPTRSRFARRAKRSLTAALALAAAVAPPLVSADADLAVQIAVSGPVLPGHVAALEVTIDNFGPDPAEGVVLTCDHFGDASADAWVRVGQGSCTGPSPLLCQLGRILPLLGSNGSDVIVDLTAGAADLTGGMELSCTVATATPDPGPGPNTATALVAVVPWSSGADLKVLAPSSEPRDGSGLARITVEVQNLGPAVATQTSVRAALYSPTLGTASEARTGDQRCVSGMTTCGGHDCLAVTCAVGDLAPGGGAAPWFEVDVVDGTYDVLAEASSLAPDPTPLDARVSAAVVVSTPPPPPSAPPPGGCGTAGTSSVALLGVLGAAARCWARRRGFTTRAARRAA